jgi:hypothetical protein
MNPNSSKQSSRIVAFASLYCRFSAPLHLYLNGFLGFEAEPLSHSHRICRIRRSGGAE